MRTCTKCRKELPLTSFGKVTKAHDGLNTRCKPCVAANSNACYHANADEINRRSRLYTRINSEWADTAPTEEPVPTILDDDDLPNF